MATTRQLYLLEEDIKEHRNLDSKLKKIKLNEEIIELNESSNLEIKVEKNSNLTLKVSKENKLFSKVKLIISKDVNFNLLLDLDNKNAILEIDFELKENSNVKVGEKIKEVRFLKINSNLKKNSNIDIKGIYNIDNHKCAIFHNNFHIEEKSKSNLEINGFTQNEAFVINDGLVNIKESAPNSIGHQKLKNVLLSDKSKVYSEPQLEVSNNAVECSHGSSISKFSGSDLFYLMSRGLSIESAKKLIIEDSLNSIDNFVFN